MLFENQSYCMMRKSFILLIQGAYLLTGGFFRLFGDMPKPVWRYPFSYISFNTWVNKVISICLEHVLTFSFEAKHGCH